MTYIVVSAPRRAAPKALRARLYKLLSLSRQRRALAQLDEHALDDIGITRAEADAEAKRPLWDAPDNWHKQLY